MREKSRKPMNTLSDHVPLLIRFCLAQLSRNVSRRRAARALGKVLKLEASVADQVADARDECRLRRSRPARDGSHVLDNRIKDSEQVSYRKRYLKVLLQGMVPEYLENVLLNVRKI